jgi:hypothetical protein
MTTMTRDGMTLTLTTKIDARIRKVEGTTLTCRSTKAARELKSELGAWGAKARLEGRQVTVG